MINIKINLDHDLILKLAKKNTHTIDNIEYTYDREFDILRIRLGDSTGLVGKEINENVYIIQRNNKIVYVEISNFIDANKFNYYINYLGKDVANKIKDIYKQILK